MEVTSDLFDPQQLIAYEKFVRNEGGILWMLVGEGKTRPALAGADAIIKKSGHTCVLIVARRAAFYDWEQEVATLQLDYTIREIENCPLNGVYTSPTIILVSEGRIFNDVIQDMIRQLYRNKQLGCIIADEGWLYKNPQGKKHKSLRRWAELVPTILLSGSIMTARDITDIFGQVAVAGRASVLGRTLTNFRTKFMTGIAAVGQMAWSGGWFPKPGAYQEIMKAIEPFTHVYMPDVRRVETKSIIIKVKPTDEQLALIKELKETAALEGKFELTNMASIITKAQQISGGWIKHADKTIEKIPSNKIERLRLLVADIMDTEYKCVIWCAFRGDIDRLYPIMFEYSEKVATMQSGQPFNIELWNDPKCRICLATEASGSSVNHFAQVPYAIYFSQDSKWHSLQQSSGRHARRSSQHDTAYNIFLHTEKSLDAQVHFVVRASQHSERSFVKQMDVMAWLKGGGKG
jgi:hypothetical protein